MSWYENIWNQALKIWGDGGWAMYAIAVIALIQFGLGVHMLLGLRRSGFLSVPESRWRRWVTHAEEREGPVGDMLDFVSTARSLEETGLLFDQLRVNETARFERDMKVMKICVSAAPLVGLLGTVTGMLATFGALSSGSGGDQTMKMIAAGISEALITTETGLVVALPGLFFQYQIVRLVERFKAFIAHMETVCTQVVYRKLGDNRDRAAREAAREAIAQKILQRVAASPQTI